MAKTVKVGTRQRSTSKGAWDRITPVHKSTKNITMSVYGNSNTGKTTFACTFPKPLLLVGAEDGTESIYDVKGVQFVKLENPRDFSEVIEGQRRTAKFKPLVLDTATVLQDLVLRATAGPEHSGKYSISDYGDAAAEMRRLIDEYQSLSDTCHVVVIAQEREFNVDEESVVEGLDPWVSSALMPAVIRRLNPAMDFVVRCFIDRTKTKQKVKIGGKVVTKTVRRIQHCIRLKTDGVCVARVRTTLAKSRELPEVITDPTYQKLIDLL